MKTPDNLVSRRWRLAQIIGWPGRPKPETKSNQQHVMNTKTISIVFHCLNTPTAMLLLLAATLLGGCSNIPKADFGTLKANCPNLIGVGRFDLTTGVVANVSIKKTSQTSAELDSARTLKQLAAGTNSIVLAGGEGKRLLEVGIERLSFPISRRYYTLDRLQIPSWTNVGSLSDEQLSKLASRKSSFAPETVYVPELRYYLPTYIDYSKSSRDHCKYKDFHCPKIQSYHYKIPNCSVNVKCPPPVRYHYK